MAPDEDVAKLQHMHDMDVKVLERKIAELERDCSDLRKQLVIVEVKLSTAEDHLRWLQQSRKDLQEVVDGKRWATLTRQIVGWTVGAVIGALMLWAQVGPWVKSLIKEPQ